MESLSLQKVTHSHNTVWKKLDLTGGKYVESIAVYLAKWHLQRVPGSSESSLWSTIEHWLSLGEASFMFLCLTMVVPDTFPTPEKDKKFKELDFAKIKNEVQSYLDMK